MSVDVQGSYGLCRNYDKPLTAVFACSPRGCGCSISVGISWTWLQVDLVIGVSLLPFLHLVVPRWIPPIFGTYITINTPFYALQSSNKPSQAATAHFIHVCSKLISFQKCKWLLRLQPPAKSQHQDYPVWNTQPDYLIARPHPWHHSRPKILPQ